MTTRHLQSIIPNYDEITEQDLFGLKPVRMEMGLWQLAVAGWRGASMRFMGFDWQEFFTLAAAEVLFDLADLFQSHLTTATAAAMVQSQ